MDLSRIEDFLANGEGQDINLYDHPSFVAPPPEDKEKLYDYLLYTAIKIYGFDAHKYFEKTPLSQFIPENFLENCSSFEAAQTEIRNLKNLLSQYRVYTSSLSKYESLKERFERRIKRLTSSQIGGGEKFFSSKLHHENDEFQDRLYIPCNSEHCYKFARLIIEKSFMHGLDFEFKIMNVENKQNGADNIVMYIVSEDFSKQVNMINEIISENPDITFGSTHMFGYPVNEHIALAPELGGNSYSGHMRKLVADRIAEYGRTSYCAKRIQGDVIDILNEHDVIEDMDRILHTDKNKQ